MVFKIQLGSGTNVMTVPSPPSLLREVIIYVSHVILGT
jgi:hypothetical protein